MIKGEWRATHVSHDGILGNTPHGVFYVLFDQSTESGFIELGGSSAEIRRTVFPELNDFITNDKADHQEMRGSENGR